VTCTCATIASDSGIDAWDASGRRVSGEEQVGEYVGPDLPDTAGVDCGGDIDAVGVGVGVGGSRFAGVDLTSRVPVEAVADPVGEGGGEGGDEFCHSVVEVPHPHIPCRRCHGVPGLQRDRVQTIREQPRGGTQPAGGLPPGDVQHRSLEQRTCVVIRDRQPCFDDHGCVGAGDLPLLQRGMCRRERPDQDHRRGQVALHGAVRGAPHGTDLRRQRPQRNVTHLRRTGGLVLRPGEVDCGSQQCGLFGIQRGTPAAGTRERIQQRRHVMFGVSRGGRSGVCHAFYCPPGVRHPSRERPGQARFLWITPCVPALGRNRRFDSLRSLNDRVRRFDSLRSRGDRNRRFVSLRSRGDRNRRFVSLRSRGDRNRRFVSLRSLNDRGIEPTAHR
jgi:hypothetical protein